MYELIQGHGRTDMYLHYATVVGDFERVVEHWIMEEEWTKAIDVVNRQVRNMMFSSLPVTLIMLMTVQRRTVLSLRPRPHATCSEGDRGLLAPSP